MPITCTSWTANNDPDNPGIGWDVADIEDFPHYIHAETARQALNEKYQVIQGAPNPPTPPAVATTPIDSTTTLPGDWGTLFDAAVDTIILGFINHAAESDWHDTQCVIEPLPSEPNGVFIYPTPWTEAAIMADIGAARLRARDGYPHTAAWMAQQRQILDRLCWWERHQIITYIQTAGWKRSCWVLGTWAEALALWPAAPWVLGSPHGPCQHLGRSEPSTPYASIQRTRYELTWPARAEGTYTGAKAIDYYVTMGGGQYEWPYWEDSDYGTTASRRWAKVAAGVTSRPHVMRMGDFDPVTIAEPTGGVGTHGGWVILHLPPEPAYELYASTMEIAKFNVPGGFTFQAAA